MGFISIMQHVKLINYDSLMITRLSTSIDSSKVLGAMTRFDIWYPIYFKTFKVLFRLTVDFLDWSSVHHKA
jgi:hypothetical protein